MKELSHHYQLPFHIPQDSVASPPLFQILATGSVNQGLGVPQENHVPEVR